MLMCAFIAITGRGVVSILIAIVGVIFAIEGFWGAVRFDRAAIKRFLIYLCCECAIGLTFGILNLNTVGQYCATAVDEDEKNQCETTAQMYAYILISLSVGLIPILFTISTLFYLKLLSVHRSQMDPTTGMIQTVNRTINQKGAHRTALLSPETSVDLNPSVDDGSDEDEDLHRPVVMNQWKFQQAVTRSPFPNQMSANSSTMFTPQRSRHDEMMLGRPAHEVEVKSDG